MGIPKKKDWIKWIRKNLAGLLDSKTGSMETLIESGSTKTVNYVYSGSSVIGDEELVDLAVPPLHQRPMLPPPPLASVQDPPSTPQSPNDVYDCCVSLDGIPIKHEFQYTLSDTDGYGKITKNDVEGLASKILESMYGTTANFSSRGQRTVKVTLSIRPSAAAVASAVLDDSNVSPSSWNQLQLQQQQQKVGRERRSTSSANKLQSHYGKVRAVADETDGVAPLELSEEFSIYGQLRGSSPHQRLVKSGAQRYKREQLIEMVQKSLAENLSFQNQRKSIRPEGYHRTRTKRRQSSASTGTASQLQSTPLQQLSPPSSAVKPKPSPKVDWSPYDFEPPLYIPSPHHHEKLKEASKKNQQQYWYSHVAPESNVVNEQHGRVKQSSGGRQQHHRSTAAVGVISNNLKSKDRVALQEQTKNVDDQRNKRAKLAAKKTYHHVHEHHHYHHYNYI